MNLSRFSKTRSSKGKSSGVCDPAADHAHCTRVASQTINRAAAGTTQVPRLV